MGDARIHGTNGDADFGTDRHEDRRSGNLADLFETLSSDPELKDFELDIKAQLIRYGERVRASRKAQGMTQSGLSRAAGVTQAKISTIENGTMEDGPTLRTMARLAHALGDHGLLNLTETMRAGPEVVVGLEVLDASTDRIRDVMKTAFEARQEAMEASMPFVAVGQFGRKLSVLPVESVDDLFPNGWMRVDALAARCKADEVIDETPTVGTVMVLPPEGHSAPISICLPIAW